ncbi:uncharacterized protein LOC144095359 [Amblyomma americanum]
MSNRSMKNATKKTPSKRSISAAGEALGGESEGEVELRPDDATRRGSDGAGTNGKRLSQGTGLFAPYVDVKADLMEASIRDVTSSYQSSNASKDSAARGQKEWRPNESKGADAASSLSEGSNEEDTPLHATPRVLTITPPSPMASSADILVDEEDEPKKKSFLKRVSSQLSTSSYSLDEPLSQVSIAIFSICFLFVVVASTVIVYSCGAGPCNETGVTETTSNHTALAAPPSSYWKTNAS